MRAISPRAILLLALPLLLGGCFGLSLERATDGPKTPVELAANLVLNESTLNETVETVGPPDLVIRVTERDRVYYVAWDSDYLKFVFSIGLPFGGSERSKDLFVWTRGTEDLKLVRLDYDRGGVLREKQVIDEPQERDGKYVGLENSAITQFLEDRERALRIRQPVTDAKTDWKKGKNEVQDEAEDAKQDEKKEGAESDDETESAEDPAD